MARLFACLLLLIAAPVAAQVPVAAAASLRYALDDAAAAFTKATGERVRISYAASGNLVQQIEAGAPYQLFLSADEDHVFRLADKGLTPDRGIAYAVGRLVYITPPGSALLPDSGLRSLKAGLADGRIRRLAIANPETAPYGARTVEALKASGLWTQAQPRLVTGENIAQAFQFVASGAADAGFTSLSLAISPGFKGRYALVPANLHQPLTQRMVLLKSATPPARRFHDWLLSPSGQKLLARHGYRPPPDETLPDDDLMDWQALTLSLRLGAVTLLLLLPPAVLLARWLATTPSRWKPLVETLVVLPLVLPPTVLGFYLLAALGPRSPVGQLWETLTGGSLVFSFPGLVAASVLVNIPFAVQPAQRGFEAVGADLRAAAATCGLSPVQAFRQIELPLAAPGLLTGAILAFAHTLGEFGVVLMVGGAIPGETRTLSLALYDRVQALDTTAAATMAATLLVIAITCVGLAYALSRRKPNVGA